MKSKFIYVPRFLYSLPTLFWWYISFMVGYRMCRIALSASYNLSLECNTITLDVHTKVFFNKVDPPTRQYFGVKFIGVEFA